MPTDPRIESGDWLCEQDPAQLRASVGAETQRNPQRGGTMRRSLLLVALLAVPPRGASAEIVEYQFTGEVESVNPFFTSIVSLGSPLSGRLTYDTAAIDLDPSPSVGRYPGAVLDFTMGSYSYVSEGSINVFDDPGFDEFQFQGSTDGAEPIDGLALRQVTLSFGGDPTLLGSDALPAVPPALDDPALSETEPPALRIGVIPPSSGVTYQYAVLQAVPEPGAAAAALAVGSTLSLLRRREPRRRG